MQKTLKSAVTLTGQGLHSGVDIEMTIHPASAEHGIWFRRTDVVGQDQMVPAIWSAVVERPLCTQIENEDGVTVSTIEHVMAALHGCGIQNALIDLSGPEVPILDGSAAPFVKAILAKGIQELARPVRAFRVLKTVSVQDGDAKATLAPADGLSIDFDIDFEDSAIGQQNKTLNMANGAFVRELSDSRTFCRNADVEYMHANGLALGGTFENAVVVEGEKVLSPGGLRHRDEAVRHKMLDALGDLATAGAPILGRYVGNRAGHAMTNRLLRALFADPSAYEMIECDEHLASQLPGEGVDASDLPASV